MRIKNEEKLLSLESFNLLMSSVSLQEEGKKWILKPSVVDKAVAVEVVRDYKHLKSVLSALELLTWNLVNCMSIRF